MRKSLILAAGLTSGLIAGVAFGGKAKEPVLLTATELKFEDMKMPPTMKLPEGAKPPSVALVQGDYAKGAHMSFVRFQAGETHALHTHSADVHGVVTEGVWLVGAEGAEPKKLPAGSYFMIPANWKHTSGCDASAPCAIFQTMTAKFDLKPVVEKVAKAPKGEKAEKAPAKAEKAAEAPEKK